ncbi:23S rRNA (pseudouridine(1915)-N(3))-methyltransferase RlmH [Geofilum rhodophaeum]|uniref:23S rRNA (pseudouridine(1915)-N(3))-methyltransferase RlmH n=1 Tax=Geofilum rhodophaeum TaxID=1965019 RepID=UPI000B52213B|nr:23S rRNA (pseudouridine(1915)-N(3))-methyltransferase RlmH [Geofilum rhodophaeum]
MKTVLVMVGRTNAAWLQTGIDEYVKRLGHYAPFELLVIPDVKKGGSLPQEVLKEREGRLILDQLTSGDVLVLLDENGKLAGSREFAGFVQKQMVAGVRRLFFIIGGAYGFSAEVYGRANYKLSLSKMTFSHQMVRLIFVEQLYRAHSILNNEPYHHD